MVRERERWGVRGLEGAVRTLGGHVCQKVAEDITVAEQVAHRVHVLALKGQMWPMTASRVRHQKSSSHEPRTPRRVPESARGN